MYIIPFTFVGNLASVRADEDFQYEDAVEQGR